MSNIPDTNSCNHKNVYSSCVCQSHVYDVTQMIDKKITSATRVHVDFLLTAFTQSFLLLCIKTLECRRVARPNYFILCKNLHCGYRLIYGRAQCMITIAVRKSGTSLLRIVVKLGVVDKRTQL